jgi:uncharacterized protein YndB with AHSA1/START domain
MENTVVDTIAIAAPPSKIWDILTRPEWTEKYMFGCRTISDWKPGSTLEWRAGGVTYVTGYVVRNELPRELEYTIVDVTKPYAGDRAQHLHVTYALNGNMLTVTSNGYATVADGPARYEETMRGGGWKSILEKIKELAEAAS